MRMGRRTLRWTPCGRGSDSRARNLLERDAIDLIKSGHMVASGDFNGFIEGCVAAQLAIRAIRKEPVPKEAILRTVVVDKSNFEPYELPVEKRTCPPLEQAVAN